MAKKSSLVAGESANLTIAKAIRKARKTVAAKTSVTKVSGQTETVTAKAKSAIIYSAKDVVALDTSKADSNIKAIRQTGTKMRRLAHTTACGILLHWQEHGDWTKLTDLANAIGDVMSKRMQAGFYDWIKAFSSLSYDTKSGKFKSTGSDRQFNLTGNADAPEDTLARKGALNQPFYDGNFGDAPLHSFDFDTALKTLLERADRELKRKLKAQEEKDKAQVKRINIDDAQFSRLEKFAASLGVKLEEKAA